MTNATPSPPPATDRYRLRQEIATGGMATVYLADDLVLERPVALKVLIKERAADPTFVDRFRREAQAAGRLRHPNIVTIYDTGPLGESYFIAMEYVEGRTLDEILAQDGPLSPARAAAVAGQMIDALDAAHRQGLVHRDVKPSNAIVTASGQLKLTDFGIARAATGGDVDLTQIGMIVGTAAYLSPEQAQGLAVDHRSDFYSLGVVLFEALTGQRPFGGNSALAVAAQHVSTPAPRLRSVRPSLPPELDELVDRLLAKDPADRYQSSSELAADLRRFEDAGLGVPASAPGDAVPVQGSAMGAGTTGAGPAAAGATAGAAGAGGTMAATEIMPESARPDRPQRLDRPDRPVPQPEPSGSRGLLVIGAAVLVTALVVAILLVASGIGPIGTGDPDPSTTTVTSTIEDASTTSAPDDTTTTEESTTTSTTTAESTTTSAQSTVPPSSSSTATVETSTTSTTAQP